MSEVVRRYRYVVVNMSKDTVLVRDDGYRWEFMYLESSVDGAQRPWGEWIVFFEYKHCDMPGPAGELIDMLFLGLEVRT